MGQGKELSKDVSAGDLTQPHPTGLSGFVVKVEFHLEAMASFLSFLLAIGYGLFCRGGV